MGCICQRFSRVQTTPSLAHDLTTMYPLGCFPEGPWWRSLLSAGLCSCDEELSWSWLEREALSLEEFSIRNVYISCFCELMQKQGWLGQCLSDGIKRKVRSMGRFGGPFTSIYEIHEMVTLARIFAWGKWDRTKKLRKLYLLICYICVTAHAPCLQPRCGTKPLRAALQPVKRTWDTSITQQVTSPGLHVPMGWRALEVQHIFERVLYKTLPKHTMPFQSHHCLYRHHSFLIKGLIWRKDISVKAGTIFHFDKYPHWKVFFGKGEGKENVLKWSKYPTPVISEQ